MHEILKLLNDRSAGDLSELNDNELQQLIADAMERLRLHIQQLARPQIAAA